jgi:hypothetical protein
MNLSLLSLKLSETLFLGVKLNETKTFFLELVERLHQSAEQERDHEQQCSSKGAREAQLHQDAHAQARRAHL